MQRTHYRNSTEIFDIHSKGIQQKYSMYTVQEFRRNIRCTQYWNSAEIFNVYSTGLQQKYSSTNSETIYGN
jgi:hypothetical protein